MGTPEIMLIMLAVLLLFGGKKLPELARGLGKGIREFKDASDGVKREIHRNINSVHDDITVDVDKPAASSTEPQTDQTQSKL
jgi:sec-independent protein translocase protein TatA